MIAPEDCQTMAEVRAGVDEIDERVVELLRIRFGFMDAAARIKPTREEVRDNVRKAAVIEHVRGCARAAGIPEDVVAQIYETLIEGSIAYEFDKFDARNPAH
jgi:isochorismate pyruvate lyase